MSETNILSREVVTEWAGRGNRPPRSAYYEAMKIGPPIKAELIAAAQPLIDCIQKHGVSGAMIPMQDTPDAKDINIHCYPLHEEIQFVLETWGSIHVEVDSSYSRQRFTDSHEALRADRDKWREESSTVQQRYDNLSASVKDTEAALDAARSVCAEVYQFAGCVGAPVRVLDNLSDVANGGKLRHKTILPVYPEECILV